MNGKILGTFIVGAALVAGAALYYLQVYAYYKPVDLAAVDLRLTSAATGAPDTFRYDNLQAIDADSSPLRFRACMTTTESLAALAEKFAVYDGAEPLVAPGWFDCFDAAEVGAALEEDRAVAFLARRDIRDGVDRVVAVLDDGRAFAWHQLYRSHEQNGITE